MISSQRTRIRVAIKKNKNKKNEKRKVLDCTKLIIHSSHKNKPKKSTTMISK